MELVSERTTLLAEPTQRAGEVETVGVFELVCGSCEALIAIFQDLDQVFGTKRSLDIRSYWLFSHWVGLLIGRVEADRERSCFGEAEITSPRGT